MTSKAQLVDIRHINSSVDFPQSTCLPSTPNISALLKTPPHASEMSTLVELLKWKRTSGFHVPDSWQVRFERLVNAVVDDGMAQSKAADSQFSPITYWSRFTKSEAMGAMHKFTMSAQWIARTANASCQVTFSRELGMVRLLAYGAAVFQFPCTSWLSLCSS